MRVVIMADIHGNIEALKSVLEYLSSEKIDKLVLLGDMIDYCPHSNEVIQVIDSISYDIICNIRGNHEDAILNDKYERFSSDRGRDSARYTKSILNEKSWHYLVEEMDVNQYKEIEIAGKKCLFVHGSLEDTAWKAIKPGQDLSKYVNYDYVFSGHSHLPHVFSEYYACDDSVYRNKKRTVFINPGSVGQPRNHNPKAQFAIWDTDTDEIRLCCVEYDILKEQVAFSDKVDVFYKDRLIKGV